MKGNAESGGVKGNAESGGVKGNAESGGVTASAGTSGAKSSAGTSSGKGSAGTGGAKRSVGIGGAESGGASGSGAKSGPRRPYQSAVREESARRTRHAVVQAAHELFTARGYASTSLADIAAAAGVARPTAFAAFGSKPALLRQVLDQAFAGDDEPIPVAQRPWFQPVWDATRPAAVLDAYAHVCALINGRAARIVEVTRRAADQAPELGELWETLQRNRRAGARMVVEQAASRGPLATGLDTDRATDIVWIFNDPALYDALVSGCGWPELDYTTWLSRQIRYALLPSDRST